MCKFVFVQAGEGHGAGGSPGLTETVLLLMEKLLVEAAASHQSLEQYQAFAGDASVVDISCLLEHAVHLKLGTELHHHLMRVLPFLTYSNRDNMALVINHFSAVLDFSSFDQGHGLEDEARLEAWVAMCEGIERNRLGNTMKDELVRLGIVSRCTDYIKQNAPPTKQVKTNGHNTTLHPLYLLHSAHTAHLPPVGAATDGRPCLEGVRHEALG